MSQKEKERTSTERSKNEFLPIDEDFKPRLADDIEIRFYNTDERGDFFFVRNPRNKRYVKVHESGKAIMDLMDGTHIMTELQQAGSVDVYKIVSILGKGGFLSNMQEEKKKEPFYTLKIPFFKSNHPVFLKMYKFFSFVSTTPFKIFYVLFVGSGIILFLLYLPETFQYVVKNLDINEPMTPLILVMAMFYVVELAHEFAHTGASYNHGAEPGEVGIVFHFLVAFFYVETPDTRILSPRASLDTFIAGPLTSLFAGAVCTYIFVFTDWYPLVWGASAFFWHMSTAITLSPFMQTDGYYIAQNRLKFPNLFNHAVTYVRLNIFRFFRRVSKEDYENAIKGYTARELKILKVFAIFMPVQIGILVYFFFFMAMEANLFYVVKMAPVILSSAHTYGIKAYIILLVFSIGLVLGSLVALYSAYKFLKRGRTERW